MTICNHCQLKQIQGRAVAGGNVVTLRPGWNGGTEVYLHPAGVEIPAGKRKGEPGKYWVAWFMALSEKCAC